MQNLILQFLRSPTWQTHKIASTYEALFDMLATPPDTLPNTVEAFSKRWKVHRDTARKFLNEALQMVQVSNVEEFRQMQKKIGTDAENFRHSSSRVNEDNINALSDDKAEREKGVRMREAKPKNQSKTNRKVFRRPSPEEVQTFLTDIGEHRFDGHEFCDYYEQCGWVIGRDRKPMKDWRAAVRTWQRNRNKQLNIPNNQNNAPTPNYHPSSREAERQQRAQAFAQHISNLMADPTGELTPDLDF